MKLYSYIVGQDFGFAPNPFYGWCTLATCKPRIRATASVGDWIIGTGAKTKYNLAGRLIYAMRVEEILDYDSYWSDPRFFCKRPVLNGSLKQLYGDNIYHSREKCWVQADSHHSLKGGEPNPKNVKRDTSANRLLLSRHFVYFGRSAIVIPERFRPFETTAKDLCCVKRGHKKFSDDEARSFMAWLKQRNRWGLQDMPLEFSKHSRAGVST